LKVDVAVPPKYAVPVFERRVEEALVKRWRPVQTFAFVRFKPMVRAVEPLYVPLKVRVASVAERLANEEPREMPEMVEFASSALSICPVGSETVPAETVSPPENVSRVEVALLGNG
jgi:hypothetical protein